MNISRILTIVVILLSVVGIVLWFLILGGNEPFPYDDVQGYIDSMLRLGEWMAYIAAFVTLLFAIYQIATNPRSLKKTLITVAGFLVVVGIAYAVADGTGSDAVSESGSKWVGTGLYTFYFLAVLAIASIVYSGITKRFS